MEAFRDYCPHFHRLRDDRLTFNLNLEVQLLLKQGQVTSKISVVLYWLLFPDANYNVESTISFKFIWNSQTEPLLRFISTYGGLDGSVLAHLTTIMKSGCSSLSSYRTCNFRLRLQEEEPDFRRQALLLSVLRTTFGCWVAIKENCSLKYGSNRSTLQIFKVWEADNWIIHSLTKY